MITQTYLYFTVYKKYATNCLVQGLADQLVAQRQDLDEVICESDACHGAKCELTHIQVAVLFLCDTLNSAFDVAFVYVPLVQKYGTTSLYALSNEHSNCDCRRP